jgi:CBS domain-containing protein
MAGAARRKGVAMTLLWQLLTDKGREVHSIAPDASVVEAVRLMADRHIGALMVMEAGALVGVLSERD